ncbi:putative molybdopterin biosynthesis protein MoeA [Nocardia neocaledoniensis NBRC 108232]|uniref:Molybdopterin molybdenumtransferase n=1 Tax=Nocardia neocaledoniensis TaxID=236511 RepID=A0A317NVP8_9NOCA|nr:gephyrin-like molybdotransferase Glp [Nocardia neocaledoniensis]PWV79047.1 molybdopterin molybdochelatase [Nocardia neocaledoniensis]GEM33123.1 putative molybdopterin biosynthesis protein MoeA [Nocardia neocaledoniensis NBRC 108232]
MTSRPATASARSVDEYRDTVAALLAPLADRRDETVPVPDALGRVLSADVLSPIDLPVFRNSAMDGYAVRAADVAVTPVTLPVAGVVAAGKPGTTPLPDGAALKVMTGAPIPPGADCVVPVEDVRSDGDRIVVERGRGQGEFVREAGTDVRAGELVARAGTVLAPRHIAALAAVGLPSVPVLRRLRAVCITTGDELRPAGTELAPGQIYNSNGIALAAALRADEVDVLEVAHSSDDAAEFTAVLRAAVASADLVCTSGGVSKGDFEVVKEVLRPLGGVFGSVAVQPGGPQGYTVVDGVPVLSFPGNPVSTTVSYVVFARDVVRALGGLPPAVTAETTLLTPVRSPAGRRQYLRGLLTGDGVEVVSGPGSHLIAGMAWADVLVDVPAEVTSLPAGSTVRILKL